MAKKPTPQEEEQAKNTEYGVQQEPNQEEAVKQQAELDADMQMMAQIDAIDTQTRMLQQEKENKEHDTEFSPYSDANGQNPEMGNLGVIGELEVKTAYDTLMKYKEHKSDIDTRLIENEEFWKMRHWEANNKGGEDEDKRIKPKSAWLVNTILNKHADAMDNYPEANILPRSADDEKAAKELSSIIPVVLEQNEYEKTYSETQWYKAKNGTSVQGIFWNNDKNNGLGDIDIKKIDILNLYWKSGISDIQDSPNVFLVNMMDNDEIRARYPELEEKNVGYGMPLGAMEEHYGENIDTSNQTAVIDWYYKRRVRGVDDMGVPQMKTILHYCKFCNGQVIYASENDPQFAERGWYDHGQYPFVFDVLFPIESSVCGMGYIDIIKDDQLYIDKLQQAILENAVANARPRYAVRGDGSLNEEEFLDLSKPLVHFDGNLGEDAFRQIVASPLSNIYETIYLQKVQEMKDTSGNTASSQGQASSVTTASGIASLQEAAGKLSRDASNQSYRAFRQVVYQVIELIRQFYTEPRCFRIIGEDGNQQFTTFDNRGLMPQSQGMAMGIDLGTRMPIMDIQVKPQKKSAYSKESQNQTALNLYNMGFFAPNNADASLACLNMMDFDGVQKIRERVEQNGLLYQQVMALSQQLVQMGAVLDAEHGTNLVQQITGNAQTVAETGNAKKTGSATPKTSKGSLSSQAASATRNSTTPR